MRLSKEKTILVPLRHHAHPALLSHSHHLSKRDRFLPTSSEHQGQSFWSEPGQKPAEGYSSTSGSKLLQPAWGIRPAPTRCMPSRGPPRLVIRRCSRPDNKASKYSGEEACYSFTGGHFVSCERNRLLGNCSQQRSDSSTEYQSRFGDPGAHIGP